MALDVEPLYNINIEEEKVNSDPVPDMGGSVSLWTSKEAYGSLQ